MKIIEVDIKDVKGNERNPRVIQDSNFDKLVKSIQEFPEMLEKRPIVVDEQMVVLGGNMRLKACEKVGLKKVWVIIADNWTEEQKNEFVIKDNISFGDWDWDSLTNEWDALDLSEWGLEVWQPEEEEVDYSALEELDELNEQIQDMESGVKRAIQIEFNADDYEEAQNLVAEHRKKGSYIGGLIIEKLKESDEA